MTNFYVRDSVGYVYWDGTTPTLPSDDLKYMGVFMGFAAMTAGVTPTDTWTERLDSLAGIGTYTFFVQDKLDWGQVPITNATLGAACTAKNVCMINLKSADATNGIEFVDVQSNSASAQTVNVNKPTGTAVDDIMVAQVLASGSAAPTVTATGWVVIGSYYSGITLTRIYYYWKRVTSADDSITQYAFSHNQATTPKIYAAISTYSGCITGVGVQPYSNYTYTGYVTSDTNLRGATAITAPYRPGPAATLTQITASQAAAGNEIRVEKSPGPTEIGSCTWTHGSDTVTIPSGKYLILTECDATSTASPAVAWQTIQSIVPVTNSSYERVGTNCIHIPWTTAASLGDIACVNLTCSDSNMTGISMYLLSYVYNWPVGRIKIKLYDGQNGTGNLLGSYINDYIIDYNKFCPIYFDTGASLSGLQSISFENIVAKPSNNSPLYIDQIVATLPESNAAHIRHASLIGRNSEDDNTWWGVHSFGSDGTSVVLSRSPSAPDLNTSPLQKSVYPGPTTTEAVTTYVRKAIRMPNATHTINGTGAQDNPVKYTGGWDFSSGETRNGETWYDFVNGSNSMYVYSGKNYIEFDRLNMTGSGYGYYITGCKNIKLTNCFVTNTASNGIDILTNSRYVIVNNCAVNGVFGTGLQADSSGSSSGIFVNVCKLWSNGGHGILLGRDAELDTLDIRYNTSSTYGAAIYSMYNTVIARNIISENNYRNIFTEGSKVFVNNMNYWGSQTYSNSLYGYGAKEHEVIFTNVHNNDSNLFNYRGALTGVSRSETTERHTASGISWKLTPINYETADVSFPYRQKIATIAVPAGTISVGVYMKRSAANIQAKLVIPGYQVAGIDLTEATLGTGTDWTLVSASISPTVAGALEVFVDVWGGVTTSCLYIDDLIIVGG